MENITVTYVLRGFQPGAIEHLVESIERDGKLRGRRLDDVNQVVYIRIRVQKAQFGQGRAIR